MDWAAALASEDFADTLSPRLRSLVAEHWTRAALMEHASIAAFARFSLELLALGAPADLVSRSARAMADETEHARLCFALATRYGAESLGPGPISGCLDASDPVAIFSTAFLEACVGETLAASEVAEAARYAESPGLRATLTRIAEDEARHAELGWRFAAWMLATSEPELRCGLLRAMDSLVRGELERRASTSGSALADESVLVRHGVLPRSARKALRESTLREVVVPCVDALLRSQGAARRDAEGSLASPLRVVEA